MRDSEVCRQFVELPIEELRRVQLASGRAAVPDETRAVWRAVHDSALDVLRDDRRSPRAMALAEFVRAVTYSISQLVTMTQRPKYYTYTDVGILDWFLQRGRPSYAETRAACLTGILYLLEDISHFESDSQSGLEKHFQRSFDHNISSKRIALTKIVVDEWRRASNTVAGADIDQLRGMRQFERVDEYVDDVSRKVALIRFSCFPQTECHDEYIFLRTIHMSELAFTGIQSSVEETIEWLKLRAYAEAQGPLEEACSFALILHSIFRVLNTMPPEHFAEFRSATGDASAVQSLNYQRMEIFCSGMNPEKLATVKRIPHLESLNLYADSRFRSLSDLMYEVAGETEAQAPIEIGRELDRILLRWRGLHLAFAKTYLPAETVGTGGTTGASYLQRFLKRTIFSDTRLDTKKLISEFPVFEKIFDALRYDPSHSIAPREEQK